MHAPAAPREEIVLRPLGSSLPLGLCGLVIASLVLSGLDLRWVGTQDSHAVGVLLLAAPAPLQLLACAFALPARDAAAAASMGLLAASWIATGLIRLLSPPGATSAPLGL